MPTGFVSFSDVMEVTIIGTVSDATTPSTPIANVFHYGAAIGQPPVANSIFLAQFAAVNAVAWANVHPNTYVCTSLRARSIMFPTRPTIIIAGGAFNGTVAADTLDTLPAAYIFWKTANGQASGRGKSHIGPVPDTLQTGNALNGAGIPLFAALIAQLGAAVVAGGSQYDLIVYSRHVSSPLANPPVIYGNVVVPGISVARKSLGSMLRRKPVSTY
jgi:hypothetical protein